MEVTSTAGGEHDERAVMDRMVESDRTYVMDRGYAKFELFNRIVDAGSSYVCRNRDNSVFTVLEEKPLTDVDRAARVLSDQLISLGSDNAKGKPNHPVRLFVIEAKPHKSKGKPGTGSTGQNCDGFLRIATNLLDVPAEIIALLYHYSCMRDAIDYGLETCQSLSSAVLESFVSERLLQAVAPASLELSLAAGVDIELERKQLDDHWQQRLTRSRYEVEQARRQYNAVDPDHRLVARELERRWDESMRADERRQIEYAKFAKDCPKQLSSEEREQILALSNDLPALWHAATTSPEDRQSIARLLLEAVIVSVEGNTDRMEVELRWAGGFISRHTLLRSVQTNKQLSNFDELVARIDVLRIAGHSLPEIASKLNEEGFRPPKRSPKFNAATLSRFLRERGIRTGPQPRSIAEEDHLQTNEWWLRDLAAHLQMPIATMHRWQRVGWVTSRKVKAAGNRWAIFADAEELTRMTELRNPPRNWPKQRWGQVYCAIIACMLISLWTGRKPTLRTHEMICWYFCGMADEEELLAHLAKLHRPAEPRKPLI